VSQAGQTSNILVIVRNPCWDVALARTKCDGEAIGILSLNVLGVSGCATTYGLGKLSAPRGETNNRPSRRVLLFLRRGLVVRDAGMLRLDLVRWRIGILAIAR